MNKSKLIILTLIIGTIAGILFIILQPSFGMSTLTSRHAEHYFQIGHYSATTAVVMAWLIHLVVSLIYALMVLFVYQLSRHKLFVSLSVLLLGWITTVIAPVANFMVINMVSNGTLAGINKWPPLNFSLDEKLILHVLFFAFIALMMHFIYPVNYHKKLVNN